LDFRTLRRTKNLRKTRLKIRRDLLDRLLIIGLIITTNHDFPRNSFAFHPTNFRRDRVTRGTLERNMSSTPSTENDMVEMVSLTEFTLFPKLPAELRDQIWKFALPGPRTITVIRRPLKNWAYRYTTITDRLRRTRLGLPTGKNDQFVKANTRGVLPTPLIHACHESRQIVLRRYELAFAEFLHEDPIYFSFDYDCLYFEDTMAFQAAFDGVLFDWPPSPSDHATCWRKQLRHLAIGGKTFASWKTDFMGDLWTLKSFIIEENWRWDHLDSEEREGVKARIIASLENMWRSHMHSDSARLPEISFVGKEELERKVHDEKVKSLGHDLVADRS